MSRSQRLFLILWVFGTGLIAGVYLQHRFPLGNLRATLETRPTPAPLSVADIAAIPPHRRLIILTAGQSNAANHGETRRVAGARVYAYANRQLFVAADPLPGASAFGGSPWTRLGALLAKDGRYDAIVFASIAQGSTRVTDWAPGGFLHTSLIETLRALEADGLPADFILWQQGETEGWSASSAGADYLASLRAVIERATAVAPQARFVVSQATYGNHTPSNEQIRLAQASAALLPNAAAGPDFDQFGNEFRSDGVHFNDRGLSAVAHAWLQSLAPFLGAGPVERSQP